jgi:hypothetical protein
VKKIESINGSTQRRNFEQKDNYARNAFGCAILQAKRAILN